MCKCDRNCWAIFIKKLNPSPNIIPIQFLINALLEQILDTLNEKKTIKLYSILLYSLYKKDVIYLVIKDNFSCSYLHSFNLISGIEVSYMYILKTPYKEDTY